MELYITVKGQIAVCEKPVILSTSKESLYANFTFDGSEWDDCTKTALFTRNGETKPVLIADGICKVPAAVIKNGGFLVSVLGTAGEVMITTTNQCSVMVNISGYIPGITEIGADENTYENILATMEECKETEIEVLLHQITGTTINGDKELVISYRDGTTYNTGRVVGYSTYEIAVQHGYTGTEEEWIAEEQKYSDIAKASADTASAAATSSAAAEVNAKSYSEAAATSAEDASRYAASIESSVAAAKESETNAKASETAAKTSETNAKNSEVQAEYWAGQAQSAAQGDMMKSVYDSNNNGIVDNAEMVSGHYVDIDVPATAKFTDTIYDDSAVKARISTLENAGYLTLETLPIYDGGVE